jgi:hypothetical protein
VATLALVLVARPWRVAGAVDIPDAEAAVLAR